MSGSKTEYLLNSLPTVADVSEDQVRADRVTVADRVRDPEGCLEALEMLGIGSELTIWKR